ncbi:MAG: nitrous oxide reductase family maturation protein NosD [Gemmatimonadaceae bacterium]
MNRVALARIIATLTLAGFVACSDAGATREPACPSCPTLDHATHAAHGSHRQVATIADSAGELGAMVAAAPAFTRLVIPAGVYREPTIVIDKALTLVADTGAILDGEGKRTVILVQADDVTITGFIIRHTGSTQVEERAGIRVREARRCVIGHNRFEETAFAVYLEKTSDCLVHDNVLRGSGATQMQTGNGIHAWSSEGVTVVANDVSGHRDGIYFEFVRDGRVSHNRSTENARYGMHFMFSDGCRYEDNVYRRNANGVAVMYAQRVTMRGNTFEHNRGSAAYGLLLKDINDSRIESNRFSDNAVGLHLEGANRNQVEHNEFSSNGLALRLLANAQDNTIADNDFAGNAFDVTTNSRSSYSTLHGNSWDRYRGYDLDRNGVGDVPHAPVTLFSLVVEQSPAALILLRSAFVDLIDLAERALPALTLSALRDESPRMRASVSDSRLPASDARR